MSRSPAMLTLLVVTAGPAAAASKPVAATPVGVPLACIPIGSIKSTQVRDDRTIDFVMRDRAIYRNTLPAACPQLGFERAFSYATAQARLCSVDIITVLRQGLPIMRGASCGLGKFQRIQTAR